MKRKFMRFSVLTVIVLTVLCVTTNAQAWKLTGNAGTDSNINFLGTTDQLPVIFKTNNVERMRINVTRVGIGTKKPAARLNVFSTDAVSLTTPGMLMLGNITDSNLIFDYNTIQSRSNGHTAPLYLNRYGGFTYIGASKAITISNAGNLTTKNPVGIGGAFLSSFALNINAGAALNGINVTDPVNNFGFYCIKSGLDAGVYVEKNSTVTTTPCIEGNSSGSAAGIEGYSNTGNGVYGASTTGYGVYGYSVDSPGVFAQSENNYAGKFISTSYRGIYVESNPLWYAGYFVGNCYATGSFINASAKLSKNVTAFNNAMNIINQLQPKHYEYRQDGYYAKLNLPVGSHYGLMAEDVEKVLPELVKDAGTTVKDQVISGKTKSVEGAAEKQNIKSTDVNFKALNYDELIPIMIKGMQEQQAIIEKLQQQVDDMKQMFQTHSGNSSNALVAKSSTVAGSAYLLQNTPNPFIQNTSVRCFVPDAVKQAQLAIYNLNGQLIKSYVLITGMNNIYINAGTLSSGQYSYSLIIDGKKVDTKSMVMTN